MLLVLTCVGCETASSKHQTRLEDYPPPSKVLDLREVTTAQAPPQATRQEPKMSLDVTWDDSPLPAGEPLTGAAASAEMKKRSGMPSQTKSLKVKDGKSVSHSVYPDGAEVIATFGKGVAGEGGADFVFYPPPSK